MTQWYWNVGASSDMLPATYMLLLVEVEAACSSWVTDSPTHSLTDSQLILLRLV